MYGYAPSVDTIRVRQIKEDTNLRLDVDSFRNGLQSLLRPGL